MLIPRIRKTGAKHYKVKKCPKCGAPILQETINSKSGDFCRKCGHFLGTKDDGQKYRSGQYENFE